MTAARAPLRATPSPSPVPAPGAAASSSTATPPAARTETPTAPGPVLVFPKPASDPGRLGLPLESFQVLALERLERRVGREVFQGWGREDGGSEPNPFFLDVGGRRYRGATLLEAAAVAARAEVSR